VWRSSSKWQLQLLADGGIPVGERLEISGQDSPRAGTTIREAQVDGTTFVTLFVDGFPGSTSPHMSAVLLAYEQGRWRVRWNSAGTDMGVLNRERTIDFSADGVERLAVEGDVFFSGMVGDEGTPAHQVFSEVNAGPHRHYHQVWELRGDEYTLVSSEVEPSSYNSLTEFINALRSGDLDAARGYAATDTIISDAVALGWDSPTNTLGLVDYASTRAASPNESMVIYPFDDAVHITSIDFEPGPRGPLISSVSQMPRPLRP
jgi:hypothetical protein